MKGFGERNTTKGVVDGENLLCMTMIMVAGTTATTNVVVAEVVAEGQNDRSHFRGQARHIQICLWNLLDNYNGCYGWWLMKWKGSKNGQIQ